MTWWIDYETYSEAPLPDVGVYSYVAHESFLPLILSYAHDDGPVESVDNPADCYLLAEEIWESGETIVAHNANFERVVTSRLLGMDLGEYCEPERWLDSMVLMLENGLPGSLSGAAKVLGGEQKDEAGKGLIRMFCIPGRDGRRTLPREKPEDWAAFVQYGRQDVETMRDIVRRVGATNRTFTPEERALWCTDQRINDRGVRIDVPLANAAVAVADSLGARDAKALEELTGISNARSVVQLLKWCQEQDPSIPNLRKDTVADILADDSAPEVLKEAMRLRVNLALVAGKKFAKVSKSVGDDGRQRGNFRFFGAHTGRWTGSGVQLHNLPRAALHCDDETVDRVRDAVVAQHGSLDGWPDILDADGIPVPLSNHTLKALVRSMILGPLVVCDFSAIEARVIAWLADEAWSLEAFANGRDIYVETAARMNAATGSKDMGRKEGKIATLALGYGGGPGALSAFGYQGDGQPLVNAWRRANANVVAWWSELEVALEAGGRAGSHVTVYRKGPDRHVELPSGRRLVYRNVSRGPHFSPALGKEISSLSFDEFGFKQQMRRETYGGRLAENVTQAVARDVLGHSMIALDRTGLPVVGHVHDEVLVEAPESKVDAVHDIMCRPPTWAEGFPLAAAAYWTPRYKKD